MSRRGRRFGQSASEEPSGNEVLAQRRREIYLEESVRQAIDDHVGSDTRVERGGVLIGTVDEASSSILVSGSIPAEHAISQPASLTFTHDTWDHINEVIEREHPDDLMVGWYHSHPRFGVFLSSYDEFIHANFFNQPWQLAYVVDPLQHEDGFFGWEDGQIVRYQRWRTYRECSGARVTLAISESTRSQPDPSPAGDALRVVPVPPAPRGRTLSMSAVATASLLVGVLGGAAIGTLLTSDSSHGSEPATSVPAPRPDRTASPRETGTWAGADGSAPRLPVPDATGGQLGGRRPDIVAGAPYF